MFNTHEDYLIEATKSILNQTYGNFEFIIVDDNSSTDLFTNEIFKDKRIIILRNEANYGPSYSRNKALKIARGKYISIMDSDDISLSTRLEKQVAFMENNLDVVACGAWFKFIGIKDHEVERNIDDNDYYRCCLIFGNSPTIIHSSSIIRKKALDDAHIKYDERLRYGEDYKQLSTLGKITNYKEILLHYRTHEKQVTHNNYKKRQSSFNDSIVKQEEILDRLQLELNEEDKDLFFNFVYAKKYNAVKYIKVLHKIIEANKITNIYQQDKIEQRVHEQWIFAVQHVKNPFKLIPLFDSQKGHRKELFKIKFKQVF